MYAALYGSQPTVQGIKLLGDLKLGQYLKIPPKVNFLVQIIGCVVVGPYAPTVFHLN